MKNFKMLINSRALNRTWCPSECSVLGPAPMKPALTVCVSHLREGQPDRLLREELPDSSQTYLRILGQREAKEAHKPSLLREKSLLFHRKHSQGIANLAKTSSTTAKIHSIYGTFIIKLFASLIFALCHFSLYCTL